MGINYGELSAIKQSASSSHNCLDKVILAWLQRSKDKVTRGKLAHAVEVAGDRNLAKNIRIDPSLQLTLPYLRRMLKPVEYRYNVLGSQLGVSHSEIKKFEMVRCDTALIMSKVVRKWFELEGDYKPSMELLTETLDDMGHAGLSESLKKKYIGK